MRGARIYRFLVACLAISAAVLPAGAASGAESTSVHIAGQAAGFLPAPCNCPVELHIAANAKGDATALVGDGKNHASTGATNHFSLAGSTDGSAVLLAGSISRSTSSFLEGSPVAIGADEATGALTFTLGPITGGPFAGQTFVFVGSGTVVVTS